MISFDCETTGLKWFKEHMIGFSTSDGSKKNSIYTSIDDTNSKSGRHIFNILEKEVPIFYHHAKFDMHFQKNEQMPIPEPGNFEDTRLISFLLDENESHHLQDLAMKYCKAPAWKEELQIYMKTNKLTHSEVPISIMKRYASGDAFWTYHLTLELLKRLNNYTDIRALYLTEKRVLKVILEMERHGLLIDKKYLSKLNVKLEGQISELEKFICKKAGYTFNLRSTQEMAHFLYNKLKIPVIAVGDKSGRPKVDEYTLQQIKHPIIEKILEYRLISKLKTTYTESLLEDLPKDNILHCNLNQCGAVTGRFSCQDPNLQQVPRENGIRNAFIPRPGYSLFFFDYNQIEMRLCAHYSSDHYMIESLKAGKDLHLSMAAKFYNKSEKEVTKQERKKIKQLNFGILYGIGADGLALKFNIQKSQAQKILNDYYNTYPMIRAFRNECSNKIKMRGYVTNHFGRRRRLPVDECYKAPNALIQGCAADLFKSRMAPIGEMLKSTNDAFLLLPIHDELIVEIKKGKEKKLVPEIQNMMEDNKNFQVPMTVNIEWSDKNWGEKKSYK